MANCGRQKFSPENARFELFLWIPESNDRTVLYMCQALFSGFEGGHFGEKMSPTSNVIKKSICPKFVENFSHGNTSHVLSHTSHHVVAVLHSSHQSLEAIY